MLARWAAIDADQTIDPFDPFPFGCPRKPAMQTSRNPWHPNGLTLV